MRRACATLFGVGVLDPESFGIGGDDVATHQRVGDTFPVRLKGGSKTSEFPWAQTDNKDCTGTT